MTTPRTALEIHLASRPTGRPGPENFTVVEVEVPLPGPGQVLVRNLVMSVDPYMRPRMVETKSYMPPYEVGQVMYGAAIGEIVESTVDDHKPGDIVVHGMGWREYVVLDGPAARKVDLSLAPASAFLGVLGVPGLTAYAGLLDVAQFREGDTLFVSGAAGAVGSAVGQIARIKGAARVIGSAGSADKVRYLRDELGFDAAFNYKDGSVTEQLAAAAPDGIDVYFDNVGGDHLEAAIYSLKVHGRVTVCGMISQYNSTEPSPAPRNLAMIISKRLTFKGMMILDHFSLLPQFQSQMSEWIQDGTLRYDETVFTGLRNAPDAFLAMLDGHNTGKMLVKLAD